MTARHRDEIELEPHDDPEQIAAELRDAAGRLDTHDYSDEWSDMNVGHTIGCLDSTPAMDEARAHVQAALRAVYEAKVEYKAAIRRARVRLLTAHQKGTP